MVLQGLPVLQLEMVLLLKFREEGRELFLPVVVDCLFLQTLGHLQSQLVEVVLQILRRLIHYNIFIFFDTGGI